MTDESNILACSAARAMAGVARPRFNPLFIHGGTGQGKTHLLHAIAGAYAEELGAAAAGDAILYMSRRAVHDGVRLGDPRQRHHGVQGAAARGAYAAHRRHPVHRRQGADAGGIPAHAQRPHRFRRAHRHCRRTGRPSNWALSIRASCRVLPGAWSPTFSPRVSICGSRFCAPAPRRSSPWLCPRM